MEVLIRVGRPFSPLVDPMTLIIIVTYNLFGVENLEEIGGENDLFMGLLL